MFPPEVTGIHWLPQAIQLYTQSRPQRLPGEERSTSVNRWDEKAGLRRDAIGSQVIDALEAQEIKETGNEED